MSPRVIDKQCLPNFHDGFCGFDVWTASASSDGFGSFGGSGGLVKFEGLASTADQEGFFDWHYFKFKVLLLLDVPLHLKNHRLL